jgi:ABC-type iron transport system FetAB ATPase subunit
MIELVARSRDNLESLAPVNKLYAAIGRQIYSVLSHIPLDEHQYDKRYYISARVDLSEEITSSGNQRVPADLLQRAALPHDIIAAAISGMIGSAEVQFFDFLFNLNTARLLTLVGKVGVGKSTFLKNVAYDLSTRLSGLDRFRFLYLDFLKISEESPHLNDIYRMIVYEAARLLKTRATNLPQPAAAAVDKMMRDARERTSPSTIADVREDILKLCTIFNRQLVFLIDNIDQLSPHFAAQTVALARTIFFSTGQPVVVAIRPATDALRIASSNGRESYIPQAYYLPPPDINSILQRRMEIFVDDHPALFEKQDILVDYHDLPIRFNDIKARLLVLFGNILKPSLQQHLYVGLCNYNIRRLFILIDKILKYRELSFNVLFFMKAADQPNSPFLLTPFDRRFLGHLIEAGMVGDRQFYTDDAGAIITNIYFFSGDRRSRCLIYYLLSYYSRMGAYVHTNTVLSEFAAFGFEQAMVERVVRHLVNRDQIDSPNSHGGDRTPTHAKLSESGKYYLSDLVTHEDYLLAVVFDTDVSIDISATGQSNIRFPERVSAAAKLIASFAEEEHALFERTKSISTDGRILARLICESPPLSDRLLETLHRICQPRKALRFGDVTAFNASLHEIGSQTSLVVSERLDAMRSISRAAREAGKASAKLPVQTKISTIRGVGTVRVEFPESFSANRPHVVKLSLQPLFDTSIDKLIADWTTDDPNFLRTKFFTMKRSHGHAPFKGQLRFEPIGKNTAFPKHSTVTLFNSANEIAAFNLDL